jgi:DNA-binding GntR family transcriptional regulator
MQLMRKKQRLNRISAPVLRDEVANAIRSALCDGSLEPGERILERDLAEELGVSRLPVREAIRKLEHEGLLVSIPRKGTFVVQMTANDIHEIFSLRMQLEAFAIRRVIERATVAERQSLQQVVDEMQEANKRGDRSALFEMDAKFHSLLCTFAHHKRLAEHWKQVDGEWRTLAMRDREQYLVDRLQSIGAFNYQHQDLVDAIAGGDANLAETAIREHLARALAILQQVMHERNQEMLKAKASAERVEVGLGVGK